MKTKSKFLFPVLISIISGLSIAGIVFAWTNPSANPPSGAGALNFSSGNVGIGTTGPGYKLDVQGGQINSSGGLCIAGDCKTAWSQVGGSSTISAANISSGQFGANTGGGNYYFPANMGIGTTNPNQKLQIVGDGVAANISLTRYGGNPGAVFQASQGTLALPTQVLANGLLGGFVATGMQSNSVFSGNTVGMYFAASENFTSSANGTYIFFSTTPIGSTAKAERMRITGAGNVGIGTTGPGYKLDVQGGQINSSGGLCIAGDCKTAWSQVGGSSTISAANVSAGSFGANTGGGNYYFPANVGIGTGPLYKLDVNGYINTYYGFCIYGTCQSSPLVGGGRQDIVSEGYVAAWTGTNTIGAAGSIGGGGIYLHTPAISPSHTYVGINTTTNGTYELQVNGSFAATSKSFDIQDPRYNDPKKRLVHATLEGPEDAVFYRGEGRLINGKAVITLPDYFEALTRKENRTVLLTPEFDSETEPISQLAASTVTEGKFIVKSIDQSNLSQKFFWEVKAVRSDIAPLQVEKTAQ